MSYWIQFALYMSLVISAAWCTFEGKWDVGTFLLLIAHMIGKPTLED